MTEFKLADNNTDYNQELMVTFGEKIVPLIEELYYYINEVDPLLDEINDSITDNLKIMPTASDKLSRVTEATENVTVEIMDIVERSLVNCQVLEKNLLELQNSHKTNDDIISNIFKLVQKSIDDNFENNKPAFIKLIEDYEAKNNNSEDLSFSDSYNIIKLIDEDLTSIMMSLQIQDITSQHLAAVNNIISTIQLKLAEIINKFEKYGIVCRKQKNSTNIEHKYSNLTEVSNLHREIAFDNNDYIKNENTGKLQSDIDDIFANSGSNQN